jgi:hypothetical protein
MSDVEFCRTLRATIAVARSAVAEGSFVDLAGFDREVGGLCDSIAGRPAAEQPDIAAELQALLHDLDELSAALTAQTGMESDAARRRAAQAYAPPAKPPE